jgi:CTP synthase
MPLKEGSLAREIYAARRKSPSVIVIVTNSTRISRDLEKEGLIFSGVSPDGKFVEMIELPRKRIRFSSAVNFIPNTNRNR